jgi:phosphatidylglycerophosphate synthase
VPARGLAKAKTWVQVIAVGMALVPATGAAYGDLLAGVLWAAVAITVVTGAQYLLDGRHVVRAV